MWIFEPEPKLSECKSCGKPIVWAITTTGARCPLVANYERYEEKTIKVRDGVEVKIISVPAKASHFADCPQAQQFSNRRKK